MRRFLIFFLVVGFSFSALALDAEESPQAPETAGPIQQQTAGIVTLNLITIKTAVDRNTGDYEVALIGRLLLAEDLPEGGSLAIHASIRDAGVKGTHGIWFYNTKLQRFCARLERKETIGRDQFIPLSEGRAYDFLWSAKVAPQHKPLIDVTIENAEGAGLIHLASSVDPSSDTPWFVAGQRYVNGAQQITLPVSSLENPSDFIQFITYGCLKPPFTEGKLLAGEEVQDVTIEDGGNPIGCKWWVTKPMRLTGMGWVFQPPVLPGFSSQVVPVTVDLAHNPASSPDLPTAVAERK